MFGGGGFGDINALSNLLSEGNDDDDDEPGQKRFTPADMVNSAPGARLAIKSADEKQAESDAKLKKSKDIWDEDEVPREEEVEDPNDSRKRPKYEILYKQAVSTEDVFLGLGDKSPSFEDCEAMVVKVHFPGCTLKDLELDVSRERFVAESETLRLSMYLPLQVDHKGGNAKWDKAKECLCVSLPIIRDEW